MNDMPSPAPNQGEQWLRVLAVSDLLAGIALAFILQTGWRIPAVGVGVGEILLAVCILINLVATVGLWGTTEHASWRGLRHWGVLLILGYLLAILLPLTLYYAALPVPGSSLRDWAAYLFSAGFLVSLAFRPAHFRRMSAALAFSMIMLLGASLLVGSDTAWYYGRFRGEALNPNQIALYALCVLLLLVAYLRHVPVIIAALLGLAVFGYLAKSDALTLAILVFVLAGCFVMLVPPARLHRRLPWLLLGMLVIGWVFRVDILERFDALWAAADLQNARMSLFMHGIEAWGSSTGGLLLGFGAGSFSGLTGPFQGSEAHNTIIDALTIGGLPMLCAVYLFPVTSLVLAYRRGSPLMFGALSALIVFSFFHFVARHPVYWLAGYAAFVYLTSYPSTSGVVSQAALQPTDRPGLKILFISYFFPPFNAIGAVRTGQTVRRLLEAGHDVRVISANRQGLPATLGMKAASDVAVYTDWIDVDMIMSLTLGGERVQKIKSTSAAPQRGSSRLRRLLGVAGRLYVSWMHVPDRYIGWYPFARKACEQILDQGWKADVIYASATPYTGLMVASNVGRRYRIPWVGELRDLWTDNPYAHHRWLSRWLERRTLRTAAALVTVSEPLAETLRRKYDCPCHVIMNGYDSEDYAALGPTRDDVAPDDHLRIVYTGQLYAGRRDPAMLFEVLASDPQLRARVRVDFYGRNMGWVAERANQLGLADVVQVHAPVSRDAATMIQRQADVLLLLTWNNPLERGVLTGKLFEYIGARRPILALGHVDGDAAELVRREGFGLASNDPADISMFIKSMLSDPSFRAAYRRAFDERADAYERGLQVDRLVEILRAAQAQNRVRA